MKKIIRFGIWMLVGIFFTASCQSHKKVEKKGNTEISGTAKNAKGRVLIIQKVVGQSPVILDKDSLTGKDFVLKFDLDSTDILYLQFQNERNNLPLLVEPKEKIRLKIGQNIRDAQIVEASPATKAFGELIATLNHFGQESKNLEMEYRQAIQAGDQAKIKQLQQRFSQMTEDRINRLYELAEKNKDNLAGAIALQMLSYEQAYDPKRAKQIYEKLAPSIKKTKYAQDAIHNIDLALVTAIGQKAPDFEAPTPEGKKLRMSDVLKKSKVLILDFWASWCRPCRRENPYVVEIYKKYHPKGLNILSISLDRPGQKDKWLKAIKDDHMDWYHVSNLQFWQDPIARQYGIQSIPSTLILDANGVIRAKNLRREKLEAKVKELLDEANR